MARAPLRRRQRPAEALADLDPDLRRDLECGHSFFEQFPDRDAMRAMWCIVAAELLPQWITEHPGTRPFAWWLFDHGIERPIISDRADAAFITCCRREARFGFLDTQSWLGEWFQEPEFDYLLRLGLIPPDELARIPFEDPDDPRLDPGTQRVLKAFRGPRRPRP
jgi:hypothetical protein